MWIETQKYLKRSLDQSVESLSCACLSSFSSMFIFQTRTETALSDIHTDYLCTDQERMLELVVGTEILMQSNIIVQDLWWLG